MQNLVFDSFSGSGCRDYQSTTHGRKQHWSNKIMGKNQSKPLTVPFNISPQHPMLCQWKLCLHSMISDTRLLFTDWSTQHNKPKNQMWHRGAVLYIRLKWHFIDTVPFPWDCHVHGYRRLVPYQTKRPLWSAVWSEMWWGVATWSVRKAEKHLSMDGSHKQGGTSSWTNVTTRGWRICDKHWNRSEPGRLVFAHYQCW